MKNKLLYILLPLISMSLCAQSSFEEFKRQRRAEFNEYVDKRQAEWDEYRQARNQEYAEFVRKRWEPLQVQAADTIEQEKEVPPVFYEEESEEETGALVSQMSVQIPTNSYAVVVPSEQTKAQPIAPVQPKAGAQTKPVTVSYYGSDITINFPQQDNLKLAQLSEEAVADAWKLLSDSKYDATLKSALDVRDNRKFCDWAYIDMLQAVTEKQYGKTNEAVLAQAYILSQSGYRIRFAMGEKRLYLLLSSLYDIYGMRYVTLDGLKFYILNFDGKEKVNVCKAKFEKEKSISLAVNSLPDLQKNATPKRTLKSKKGVVASVEANKNLIDFFSHYPNSCIGGDKNTRWAVYANTPADNLMRTQLYPQLKTTLKEVDEREGVNILLNWVQTALEYKLDDDVWGTDRVFFATETLYYPYCDCEDRAILFSRLVRDLMGLDVVLLYYPGHMAAAVAFSQKQTGDYLIYKNKPYIVCDPTYIGAPVGKTMPGMNNQTAKIIALK